MKTASALLYRLYPAPNGRPALPILQAPVNPAHRRRFSSKTQTAIP